MWGDQWICQCGCHNFSLRSKCRNCGGLKKETAIVIEHWDEVMERIINESKKG